MAYRLERSSKANGVVKLKTKSLYLSLEHHALLKKLAKEKNTTMKALLEETLRKFINKYNG